jgi:hypothetical protein
MAFGPVFTAGLDAFSCGIQPGRYPYRSRRILVFYGQTGRAPGFQAAQTWSIIMEISSVYPRNHSSHGQELSRLLTAAVVNQRFRQLLLTNPETALASGYNGESFSLANEEKDLILSIRAKSLADFAAQLTRRRMVRSSIQ